MAQTWDVDDISGTSSPADDRAKLTNGLEALRTVHSGTSAPSDTVAYMYWVDTTNGVLKQRDSGNTAWRIRGTISENLSLAKTAAYTVTQTDRNVPILCNATSAGFTITLLAAATATAGFICTVTKTDSSANVVTIDGNSSETINGATTLLLSKQYDFATIICDGSNWHITASNVVNTATLNGIYHSGDLDNNIAFGTDTQDFQTGGSSRMDLSDSGVRLGGANARVTTILTDNTMAGASDTNMYTGKAIKDYVATLATSAVIAVYKASISSAASTTSTSLTDISGLSITLTPDSSSSVFLVCLSSGIIGLTANAPVGTFTTYELIRTVSAVDTSLSNSGQGIRGIRAQAVSTTELQGHFCHMVTDAPATGSSVTYKAQHSTSNATYSCTTATNGSVATLTVIELAEFAT